MHTPECWLNVCRNQGIVWQTTANYCPYATTIKESSESGEKEGCLITVLSHCSSTWPDPIQDATSYEWVDALIVNISAR